MLKLIENGVSNYKIVHSAAADEATLHAAEELRFFLKQITGCELPVVTDEEPPEESEIVVGLCARTDKYLRRMEPVGEEGFYIRTDYRRLILAGRTPRGNLYAVYGFLEKYLGCRWFTRTVSRIPSRKTIELPAIAEIQNPAFEYREPFFHEAFDADWCVRNRVNSNASQLDAARGGKVSYYRFCHTFSELVPADKYFDEHPEYFSLVDGVRRRDRTQLCLTNPDVLNIVIDGVREWMRAAPDAKLFSVSQNDCQYWCECDACRAVEEREGSHSGPIIEFVNKVAEALEDEFPDKLIDTFAYSYSFRAPAHIRPHKNVVVRMCDIECCFAHPLADDCPEWPIPKPDELDRTFPKEIKKWGKLCQRLYVWDYCTNFVHYLMPRPDLPVIVANLRFFHENGVRGLFEQGSYQSDGGWFAELKAYLLAKLMWNPYDDENVIVDEFLAAVYGIAGAVVKKIITEFRKDMEASGRHLYFSTHAEVVLPNLDFAGLEKYRQLYAEAERLAQNEAEAKEIRKAKLWFRYLEIYRMPLNYPGRDEIIDRFAADLAEFNVTKLEEFYSLERSIEWMKESLDPDRKDYAEPDGNKCMIEP